MQNFMKFLKLHDLVLRKSTPQRGFTLIELMVTIALLAILSTLAVPSFMQTIASSRLTTSTNDLYATLLQARSSAISKGQRVTVCKSNTGTSCTTGAGSSWNDGWITFVDSTRTTATPSVDSGETVSFVAQATNAAILIKGNTNVVDYVSFSADGQSKQMLGGFQTGVFRVCSTSTSLRDDRRARELTINISGRVVIGAPATAPNTTCPAP
jgi:type IV fimbrial biogenesis protein FimT